ncbi:fasciclin domain-containing protein [Cesiribacter andamanensis]|uniref:Immunogenic protein MPT70 n=1 Tax=Cesiribacter andamanensis AMV16 TaxID=1279009 RepID=M7NC91_9BACT|nr:fasciclin domain-containing protein [Cesiribacter andamanensis]EMR04761.1 Immunogenic protein MPT70 precursor [Cesiribacter andamanensis AMV16]
MQKQLNTPSPYRTLLKGMLGLFLGLLAVACTPDEEVLPADEAQEVNLDLYALLERYNQQASGEQERHANAAKAKKPSFSTLTVALAKSGLMGTVASQQLTLFAPTDEAFAALGLNKQNIGSVPNLREILLYHAVAGKVYAADLSNGFVPTLNGAAVEITLGSSVMVNSATVVLADIKARNGVLHAIDQVLLPPDMNLVELALSFDPEFSILVEAVQKAGLVNVLASGGPYTVFAPTNAAFADLLAELGASSLDDIPLPVLTKVLLYHVVEGRVYSSDLSSGDVPTLADQTFRVNTETLTITDANGREAGLVAPLLDVQATNGVVHVLDKVILPDLSM